MPNDLAVLARYWSFDKKLYWLMASAIVTLEISLFLKATILPQMFHTIRIAEQAAVQFYV